LVQVLLPIPSVGPSVHQSVGLTSVLWKMADLIWMPFGVVHHLCLEMRQVDGVMIATWEGAILGVDMGHNQWGLCCIVEALIK